MTERALPSAGSESPSATWAGRLDRFAPAIVLGIVGLIVWELWVRLGELPAGTLASPDQVVDSLWTNRRLLWTHISPTVLHTIGGFTASLVLSVAGAALVVHSRLGRHVVTPLAVVLQVVPKEAIAPLLILWFGTEDMPRLLLAFLIAFFPIFVNALSGFERVDEDVLRLARLLRASSWQVFSQVRLPAAAPEIFSGMKISITLAVIGVVVAELIAGRRGLGYLLLFSTGRRDVATSLAILTLLAVVGLVLYALVLLAERLIIYWRRPGHGG